MPTDLDGPPRFNQCLKNFLALVWTKEKSAPLSTALAFLRESISPARASFRMSKNFSNQSQSAWSDWMYSRVAIKFRGRLVGFCLLRKGSLGICLLTFLH